MKSSPFSATFHVRSSILDALRSSLSSHGTADKSAASRLRGLRGVDGFHLVAPGVALLAELFDFVAEFRSLFDEAGIDDGSGLRGRRRQGRRRQGRSKPAAPAPAKL